MVTTVVASIQWMPNTDGKVHNCLAERHTPARGHENGNKTLLNDGNIDTVVAQWDDGVHNCGNGWVRTYRCPTFIYETISNPCSLSRHHQGNLFLYHPYNPKGEPHMTLVPCKRAFIEFFSPTTQYGATERGIANHAPAVEGNPVREIESVPSIQSIHCCRQNLVIVRQIVYDRLRQRPLGRLSISPSFSSFTRILLTVHRRRELLGSHHRL